MTLGDALRWLRHFLLGHRWFNRVHNRPKWDTPDWCIYCGRRRW